MDLTSQIEQFSQRALAPELYAWLFEQRQKALRQREHFFAAFSRAGRQSCGVQNFSPITFTLAVSEPLSWSAQQWQASTLARAFLLTTFSEHLWLDQLEATFITADLSESVDLYRLLPLCWGASKLQKLQWRLSEGLRNSSLSIIQACLYASPLPQNILDLELWNRMLLKALHLNLSVELVEGRASRRNDHLDQMLLAFASEKAIAQREIPLELWDEIQMKSSVNFLAELRRLMIQHPNGDFRKELALRFSERLASQ